MKTLISFGLILAIDTFIGRIVTVTSMNNNDTTTLKAETVISNVPTTTLPTVAMEESDNLDLDSSTFSPNNVTPEDIQRTQMIAVVGFSAIVFMAICAWMFSRHYCCFIEKVPIIPGRHSSPQF
ncbi:unnamed protein product, partial [Allacma fusca]